MEKKMLAIFSSWIWRMNEVEWSLHELYIRHVLSRKLFEGYYVLFNAKRRYGFMRLLIINTGGFGWGVQVAEEAPMRPTLWLELNTCT